MKKFSLRLDDLGIRSCNRSLMLDGQHDRAEILKWEKKCEPGEESCYVLAYWEPHKEGFDLKFVGDRPFKPEINIERFMTLAEIGQMILTKSFPTVS